MFWFCLYQDVCNGQFGHRSRNRISLLESKTSVYTCTEQELRYKYFSSRYTDWLIEWLIIWLIDCLIDRSIDWLIDGLTDWLIDCMVFNVSLNATSHIWTCNQMLSTEKFMVVQKRWFRCHHLIWHLGFMDSSEGLSYFLVSIETDY